MELSGTSGNSGGAAGYEYQATASLYEALLLMLGERRVSEVVVEPDNHEDMFAKIVVKSASPDEVSSVMTVLAEQDRTVLYQMKTLSHDVWTVAAFRNVLTGGTAWHEADEPTRRRPSALQLLLDDETLHYHFITNAQVKSELRCLVGSFPNAPALPAKLLPKELVDKHDSLLRRIHIKPDATERLLVADTLELLRTRGGVPHVHVAACRTELKNLFWDCILGRRTNTVSADEVAAVMARHGARRTALPAPYYVPPSNADEAAAILHGTGCVIVIGPPDIGKAALADHLAAGFDLIDHPCQHFTLRNLDELEDRLSTIGPVLLIAKNGWTFESVSKSTPVADLATLLNRRGTDKYLIVTCDNGVYARLPNSLRTRLEPHVIELGLEHYDADRRWKIVTNHAGLDGWQLASLQAAREMLLEMLTEPFSLAFFGILVRKRIGEMVNPAEKQEEEFLSLFSMSTSHYRQLGHALMEPSEPNGEFLDQLARDALRDTIGERTLSLLASFPHEPTRHAAMLLGWFVVMERHPGISLYHHLPNMIDIAKRVHERTQVQLTPAEYIEHLQMMGVLTSTDGDWYTLDNRASDAMRRLVLEKRAEVHPVLMEVAFEFTRPMHYENFGAQLERISRLILTSYAERPLHDYALVSLAQAIDAHLPAALGLPNRSRYVANVEAAMEWPWGASPTARLLYMLHPDRLAKSQEVPSWNWIAAGWRSEIGESHETAVESFVRRLVMDFLPYTRHSYANVSDRLVQFLLPSQALREDCIRRALHALEDYGYTDFGDGRHDDVDPFRNRPALLALLAAVNAKPFVSIFPPVPKWEL